MIEEMPKNLWDDEADNWDDEPATNVYATAAFASLEATLESRGLSLTGALVLDFGCGTGLLTVRLAPLVQSVVGFDTSTAMREHLIEKVDRLALRNVEVVKSSPTKPNSYDLIVCCSVLGFVDDYNDTVAGLVNLLHPNGLFVHWDWEFDDTEDEPFGLTRAQIENGLQAAGLVGVEVGEAFAVEVNSITMRPIMGVGQKQR